MSKRNKIASVWITIAFALPYFLIPLLFLDAEKYLKVGASFFFGFGSLWWLLFMRFYKKTLDLPHYPEPPEPHSDK